MQYQCFDKRFWVLFISAAVGDLEFPGDQEVAGSVDDAVE